MALIICKECGKQISDKAAACPNCGCPVEVSQVSSGVQIKPLSKKKIWVAVGIGGIVVLVIAATFLYKSISAGGIEGIKEFLNGEDESSEIVITPEFAEAVRQYDQLEPFSEGMAAVGKNDKWGYINHKGEEVIPCQYDNYYEYGEGNEKSKMSFCASHPFSEGVAVVRLNEKWGVIDNKGNAIVEYGKYESIDDCHDGMLLAQNEGKRYMLNKNGEIAFDISGYEECKSFSEGLCEVKKDGKYGYIDTNGNLVIPCKYTTANAFIEGKAIVDYSEWGFTCIDRQGNVLYKKENLQVVWDGGYRDGMLAVYEKDGEYDIKYGFLNDKGEIAVPCFDGWKEGWSYDNIEQGLFYFSEGYTCTRKYNYDRDGNPVLVTTFIDKRGNKKSFPYNPYGGETSEHRVFSEGVACVTDNNGKVGFMNLEGSLTIPFKYDVAPDEGYYIWSDKYATFRESVALVRMGDRWGYVDKNGNDTFTETDIEAWEAKIKREKEQQRRREDEVRQEQERKRREGREVIISMSADVDGISLINRRCNIGCRSTVLIGQHISNRITVPDDKVWVFKYFEQDSKDIRLEYVRLFVIDVNGNERTYEAQSCGEFPIFGGEQVAALIYLLSGRDGNHLNAIYHFREIDRDYY